MKHRFILLVATFLIAVSNAAYAQNEIDPRSVQSLLQAQIRAGQYDEARAVLASLGGDELSFLFLEAQIAEAQGDIATAIDHLRTIVAILPAAQGARQYLATLLIVDRQFDNARYQFETLRNQASNAQERQFYTDQIANIDNYQPYGVNYQFSLYPDTNINGAEADGEIVNPFSGAVTKKPKELQPQFGWQGSLNVNGYLRARVADHEEVFLNVSGWVNRYTYETLDNESVRVSANYKYQNADTTVSGGPFFLRGWGDGKVYSTSISKGVATASIDKVDENYQSKGWSLYGSQIINQRTRVGFNLYYAHTEYDDEYYAYRENYRQRGGLTLNYALDPKNIVGLNVSGERYEEAGGRRNFQSHNSYKGVTVGASLSTVYSNRWSTELGLDYTRRDYDRLYPLSNEKRWDSIYSLKGSIQNANWQVGNFVPRLSCDAQKRMSNIDAFNTDDISCGITLTTEF